MYFVVKKFSSDTPRDENILPWTIFPRKYLTVNFSQTTVVIQCTYKFSKYVSFTDASNLAFCSFILIKARPLKFHVFHEYSLLSVLLSVIITHSALQWQCASSDLMHWNYPRDNPLLEPHRMEWKVWWFASTGWQFWWPLSFKIASMAAAGKVKTCHHPLQLSNAGNC